MTLLTVLRTSKLLSEEMPVMIIIYPSKLSHLVKPGQQLRLYHGSKVPNLESLSPTSDYALRHDFIKRGNLKLKPMLFSTASLLTASLYAVKFRGSCPRSSTGKQFGSVYAFDVKVPKRRTRSKVKVERLVCESINQVHVVFNRSIRPVHEITDPLRDLVQFRSSSRPRRRRSFRSLFRV